jgi:hypothetical protein
MHPIDRTGWGRGAIRRPFPALLVPLGILLFLAVATLASQPAVFPLFPLFPLFPMFLVALFLVGRGFGRVGAWRAGQSAASAGAVDDRPALQSGEIGKERELLLALERHGEITAARAALETSLDVAAAEEMLFELANDGHVRVIAREGTLAYALWD